MNKEVVRPNGYVPNHARPCCLWCKYITDGRNGNQTVALCTKVTPHPEVCDDDICDEFRDLRLDRVEFNSKFKNKVVLVQIKPEFDEALDTIRKYDQYHFVNKMDFRVDLWAFATWNYLQFKDGEWTISSKTEDDEVIALADWKELFKA